jgi:hypothetical protein
MIIRTQISSSVFIFPSCGSEMDDTNAFLIELTTGLFDFCNKPDIVDEPVLNINSKKGINMPIETIEKIIDRTENKEYKDI